MAKGNDKKLPAPSNAHYPSFGVPATTQPVTDADKTAYKEIVPEGYESEADFLFEWAREYTRDISFDRHNIDEALLDLRFTYVDQWDPATRAERESQGKPCLTINMLPQFIGQVIGDRRLNETEINVAPTSAASVEEAQVREGIIKSIENYSRATRVYDSVCEDQVCCGVSNFEITLEYAKNDVFEQDIFIRALSNPLAVVWDRFSLDNTGRDARHCFVEELMSREQFEKEYPDKPIPTTGFGSLMNGDINFGESVTVDDVKIVALWIMKERPATFALMKDGNVIDVTDKPLEEYAENVQIKPDGQPYIRKSTRTYAQRWLITSFCILEGPYELPLSRLPIIRVMGRVGRVGTKRYRFGLVRWARDPSLMRNYWRSIAVETLAMAPKAQWIADAASVKGREDDFRDAHLTGDPLLVYNTGKNKPERVEQPQAPLAVIQESTMNTQDIKDVTGLQDASLGVRSNEVSGKAITARQREGDVATVTYHDNVNQAIQEGGVVINELFPVCYDTIRTLRVIGKDGQPKFVTINDPNNDKSVNITSAKYDVTITTGPNFTTQRMEAAESMMEAVKVFPQIMEIAGDLLVEAQDWPGAQQIADRLKNVLPAAQQEAQRKQEEEQQAAAQNGQPVQPTPQQVQAAQQIQQAQQLQQLQLQMQMQEAQLKLAEMEASTHEAQARAIKAQMELQKLQAEIRQANADAELAEIEVAQAGGAAEDAHHQSTIELLGAAQGLQHAAEDHSAGMLGQFQNMAHAQEKHGQALQQGSEMHAASLQQKKNPPASSAGPNGRSRSKRKGNK